MALILVGEVGPSNWWILGILNTFINHNLYLFANTFLERLTVVGSVSPNKQLLHQSQAQRVLNVHLMGRQISLVISILIQVNGPKICILQDNCFIILGIEWLVQ